MVAAVLAGISPQGTQALRGPMSSECLNLDWVFTLPLGGADGVLNSERDPWTTRFGEAQNRSWNSSLSEGVHFVVDANCTSFSLRSPIYLQLGHLRFAHYAQVT